MKHFFLAGCLALAIHSAKGEDNAAAQPPQAPATNLNTISGKVIETMNASSYTYVLVDTGTAKLWAAAPQFKVKTGDAITVFGALPMAGYHSQILNRDFDSVYFTDKMLVNGAKPEKEEAPAAELPSNHPAIGGASPQVDLSAIKRAEGGQTVEEIFANKARLNGKSVKVRGKVVRYNGKILGKNWLHLKDGTGSPKNDDLMVTTSTKVKVGDTVLVTGKVSTDKDFGSGYKYSVILDDAKVKVE